MGLLDTVLAMFGLGAKPESPAAAASEASSPSKPTAPAADDGADDPTDDAADWDGPGDWAPPAWRTGEYTWEQAEDLVFEDLEDGDPTPPSWHSKRSNPTEGYSTLHVTELNTIKNGFQRQMFAVYGVPVGWGSSDAEKDEFQGRVDELEAARDGDDFEGALSAWGFIDEDHYEWVRDRVVPGYAEHGDMQELLDSKMAGLKQEMNDRISGELAGELEPVEGISMEQWAGAQAHLAQSGSIDDVLAELKLDMPAWDRVSAEWNARMARDTTATIATVYGQAFTGAGAGQFGAAGKATAGAMLDASKAGVDGEEPISFERWIEITEAQNAASAKGTDPAELLASFGMTPADWGVAGGWWGQKFASEAITRMDEYNRLSEKYRAQYATADADADVEF